MSKATDPILTPLIAEGTAIRERIRARETEREAKAAELKVIDDDLKAICAELAVVNEALIAEGAGRYCDAAGHLATVVSGTLPVLQPDRFILPPDGLAVAREHAGDHFKKLFDCTTLYTPRHGFDAIADVLASAKLLPAKSARALVTLCLIEGKPTGGRADSVRWKD